MDIGGIMSGSRLSRRGRQVQLGLFSAAFVCFVAALAIDASREGLGVDFALMLVASVLMATAIAITAVRLRQGVGRLIRSLDDTGVVMIMDRRILTKAYGRVFMESIPPFRLVPEDNVMDFVMEHCLDSGVSGVKGDDE